MNRHRPRPTIVHTLLPNRAWRIVLISCAVVASFLLHDVVNASPARASDVRIATLECGASPEVVEVSNTGADAQDLAGWKLVSDPIASESYDLSALGTLPPGSSVFIQGGPAATATFTWSTSQLFRDDDPTDFARLVNAAGATASQKACPASQNASVAPTPTASAVAVGDVPDGGGPPGDAAKFVVRPLVALAAGAALLVVGVVTFTAALIGTASPRRKQRGAAVAHASPIPSSSPLLQTTRRSRPRHGGSEPLLLALAAALAAAVIVALVNQSPSRRSPR
jgi:hypothetical protein